MTQPRVICRFSCGLTGMIFDNFKRIETLEKALRIFVATDEVMENLLWGKEPDNKIMKIMVTLGKYREAREALRGGAVGSLGSAA